MARPRATWRDPRFILGIILVGISVVAVTFLIGEARSGTRVYVMTQDVAPGDTLSRSNMKLIDARPGADVYLTAEEDIEGLQALHRLREGELVARSAVSTEHNQTVRSFVISVDDGLPESVSPGQPVELWYVADARLGEKELTDAQKVADNVSVVRIIGETGGIGMAAGTRLEIRTDSESMGNLLKYTQANGKLVAVPVGER